MHPVEPVKEPMEVYGVDAFTSIGYLDFDRFLELSNGYDHDGAGRTVADRVRKQVRDGSLDHDSVTDHQA